MRISGISLIALGLALAAGVASADSVETGQKFQQWTAECAPGSASVHTRCHIYQDLMPANGKKRLMRVSVGYAKSVEQPLVFVDVPLGVWLPKGVMLQIDQNAAVSLPLLYCSQNGCRGSAKLSSSIIKELQNGSHLKATVYDLRKEPIAITVSLGGFADGLRALSN